MPSMMKSQKLCPFVNMAENHEGIWVYLHDFLPFLQRDTTFVTSCLVPWMIKSFWMDSRFQRKFASTGEISYLLELAPNNLKGRKY